MNQCVLCEIGVLYECLLCVCVPIYAQAAEKEAQKKEELKKQRKFEKGKGKLGSKDKPSEGQSSNRRRGHPGRGASDQQEQSPFKRPRGVCVNRARIHTCTHTCILVV